MLEDLLYHSDGFRVVESWLQGKAIKPSTTSSRTLSNDTLSPSDYRTPTPSVEVLFTPIPFDEMSLTRQLFNEFRPFFRMFDDTAFRPLALSSRHHNARRWEDPFESFFGSNSGLTRAANVELSEEGNQYVIAAEVPGVKKENLEVTVGDNGRSITIEGKVISRSSNSEAQSDEATASTTSPNMQATTHENASDSAVSTEHANPSQVNEWISRSSFSRTIWLPKPVNAAKVTGKLEDGVLKLSIPKADEAAERKRIIVD